MVMKRGRQGEWPRVQRTPIGDFVSPDVYQRSDRAVAGALRYGTTTNVGPKGRNPIESNATDYEMDRVSPRRFDPMGTSLERAPLQENSRLISRSVRSRERQ